MSDVRDNTERSRFEINVDGNIAFSEYWRTGDRLTIRHTEVPKALEGRGIGSALASARPARSRPHAEAESETTLPLRRRLYQETPGIRRFAGLSAIRLRHAAITTVMLLLHFRFARASPSAPFRAIRSTCKKFGSCLALWDWMFDTLYVRRRRASDLRSAFPDHQDAHTFKVS